MNARRAAICAAFAIGSALLALYTARRLEVSSALTQFLVGTGDATFASIAQRVADSPQSRTLILGIRADDPARAVEAARAWAASLSRHPEVSVVRRGPDPDALRAAHDLYFPRRFLFLSAEPERDLPVRLSDDGLRAAALRLRDALAAPEGSLVAAWAGDDPLLAFADRLRALEAAGGGALRVVDGGFVAGDPPRAILFVTTVHSAFDSTHQRPLLAFLDESFAALARGSSAPLALEVSGAHRFAVASEQRAQEDAAWLSAVSLAALVICFLVMLRSVYVLLLTFIPLGFGMLAATAATLWVYGSLHSLTLAFGAALIGICTDYPLHLVCHWAMRSAGEDVAHVLAHIRRPLLMAATTTCAGFWALGSSDLPGIRQVAVFATVGVAAAAFSTLVLIPELLTPSIVPTRAQHRLLAWLRRAGSGPHARAAAIAATAGALAIAAVGLPRVRWNDDVFALNAPLDPARVAEDRALREAVRQPELGRLLAATGPDDETALRANDALAGRLGALRESGGLDGFTSLHAWVWSRDLQERNASALAAQPALAERMDRALDAAGFRAERFAGFAAALRAPAPPPLAVADLLASPLRDAVAPFRLELGDGRVALLTFLRGLRDPAALERAIAPLPGVRFFDQQEFARSLYAQYRSRSLRLVGAGAIAVVVLLGLRYRRLRPTWVAAAPALLAATATLALLGIAGTPATLLHLLGLLLVLGLGVDYGLFLVESGAGEAGDASLLSVTLDCATTLLSFGLLATSSFPALRALGTSAAIGVAASLIFALTFRALLAQPAESRR